MTTRYHVTEVEYLDGYRLRLTFADGLVKVLDLEAKLLGEVGPVFEPLRDPAFFAQVRADSEIGTIVWPNGADLAPDALYEEAVATA
jgi:hypothetical protein